MSSRSFASTIIAPFELKTLNIIVPALVVLWTLSPISGRSALRIVPLEPFITTSLSTIQYLDMRTSQSSLVNNETASQDLPSINAAFNAALLSVSALKTGAQDILGNLQLPMLEAVAERETVSADRWSTCPTWKTQLTPPYSAFLLAALHGRATLPSPSKHRLSLSTALLL